MTARSIASRIAFVLAACALSACAARQVPEADVAAPVLSSQNIELIQDVTTFRLAFTMGVTATEQAATVEKAKWELVIDGEVVKTGEEPLELQIAAGETGEVVLQHATRYVESAEELKAMSERGGSMLTALRGNLVVKSGGKTFELPFARAREIRTPRMPTVKMHSMDGATYSEEEANVIFYLGIVNPNPFMLSINEIEYKITMAGKELGTGTRGKGDKVNASSTGVYEIQYPIRADTMKVDAKEMKALLKDGKLPWVIEGELRGDLYAVPYRLEGVLSLPPPQR